MRNWDPLAIFKYLTGVFPSHGVILVLLYDANIWDFSLSLNPSFPDQDVMDKKKSLIRFVITAHSLALYFQAIIDTGIQAWILGKCQKAPHKLGEDKEYIALEGNELQRHQVVNRSVIGPSFSTLIQMCLYQGIFFHEVNFYLYEYLPLLKDNQKYGVIYELDKYDIAIVLDFSIFLLMLVMLFIKDIVWVIIDRPQFQEDEDISIEAIGKRDSKDTNLDLNRLFGYT